MRRLLSVPIALAWWCAAPLACPLVTAPPPAHAGQSVPADPGAVFRQLLTSYYKAYEQRDLAAMEGLWHPKGPARLARNLVELELERLKPALVSLQVKQAACDAGGGRARAVVDLDLTDAATGKTRRERRVREFTFLEDGGAWKIWNEGTATGHRLAVRLLAASPSERAELLASDDEMRSDDTLRGLGREFNELRSRGLNDRTLDALGVQIDLARALGNRPVLARCLLDAGLVYQVVGRLDEAGRAFVESRGLYAQIGTPAEVAALDANIASVDYVRGDYASAADRYRQALAVFEATGDEGRTANTLHSLGNSRFMLGEFEASLADYQRCLATNEKTGNKYGVSSVLLAMAALHKELGDYSTAIDAYTRSAAISAESGDQLNAARAEDGIGDVHRLVGDYARALERYAASIAHWEQTRDTPSLASTLFAAGQVHALQRSFPRAIELYQRALDIDQKAGENGGIARDLGGLAGAHFGMGELEAALEEYKKSLVIREQLKDVRGTMWTLTHMGVLHTAAVRHAEALDAYQKALHIAEQQGEAGAVCTILALRGANELAREDAETALSTSANAATMAERLELFDALAFAKTTTGKALRRIGRGDEAGATLVDAIAALERVPTTPGTETFFDDRRAPYAALIDLLVEQGRPADAFAVSEQARTRALARQLGGDGSIVVSGLSQEERDQEGRLLRTARSLGVKLRRERAREHPDQGRLLALRADLERAQAETTRYRETLFAAHPGLRALRAQSEPATSASAATVLRAAEALVSFAVSESRTHVFVIGKAVPGGIAVGTIEKRATDLATQAAALRAAVIGRRPSAARLAQELHALLLAPIAQALAGSRQLVIVPDAFLWALPFEALADESGRWLVREHPIAYASSLTALSAMRAAAGGAGTRTPGAAPARRRLSLVAAADPVLSPAARARVALVQSRPGTTASSAQEIRSLATLFGPSRTLRLVRQQAHAGRVSAAATPGSILHIAVPGWLTDASPLHSLVELPLGASGADADALLEVVDVLGRSIPADLAVLPRLEHASGAATGEALSALAWALFVSGSPTTVVSRWQPSEAAGRDTIVAFYRAWLSGASLGADRATAASALQKAAGSAMARPGAEPADWAWLMAIGR